MAGPTLVGNLSDLAMLPEGGAQTI
jgi:hypothetical protein